MEGATFCNLSFGRKEGSGRSFNRMGWCMTEYDDKNDHVLCKVHRSSSSLAKGKSKNSSGCKRKATVEHPQAPPTKMSLCASVDDQVQPPLPTGQQMTMPECEDIDYESLYSVIVDHESLFPIEEFQQITMEIPLEDQQLQQNILFPAEEQQQLQQNILLPGEEQQQPEQNILFPAEEQQQPEQNILFPGEEQQQQNIFNAEDEQFEENTLFSMEELLRSPGYGGYGACSPNHIYTVDDLFNSCSGCCDTPKAMGPPDAVFFEGLAAF
nr:unnamed protein product [Digitaria exilis]